MFYRPWRLFVIIALASTGYIGALSAQPKQAPAEEVQEPVLRLEAGGPTSFVTTLSMTQDGNSLYVAGWDKVVRLWQLDPNTKKYTLRENSSIRVPLGPGLSGAVNATALSPDGQWLAVAGKGLIRQQAGFRQPGVIFPRTGAMTAEMRQDEGLIAIFHTATGERKQLRGHLGPVVSMNFAPARGKKEPLLVSYAQEVDSQQKTLGVVRVWDVSKSEYVTGMSLAKSRYRPALAVMHRGDAQKQLQVVVASGEGTARSWTPADNRYRDFQAGSNNNTAAFAVQTGRLYTGSGGTFREWSVQGNAVEVRRQVTMPNRGIPQALALFSSRQGGQQNRAAIVSVEVGQQLQYSLIVVDLDTMQLVGEARKLWAGRNVTPALAASSNFLAVAGNAAHEVWIFPVNANGNEPLQKITSRGQSYLQAAFVKNGDRAGIVLSPQPKAAMGAAPQPPRAGDLIVDLPQRNLLEDVAGWQLDAADAGQWKAAHGTADNRFYVNVSRGNNEVSRISLPPNQVLTDYALLPPTADGAVPLVAVALAELGQPALRLYVGTTGEQVREFTGHTARIRSLAFSKDGRFLVSAADDQTTRVWSLTDLDQTFRQRGMIPGLALSRTDAGLRIDPVDEFSKLPDRIVSGMVLAGIVVGNNVRKFETPEQFYRDVSMTKPGTQVTLRTLQANQAQDIAVVVGQGIDERKPLFSFFVTAPDNQRRRDWVGWSPLGPYEASRTAAERLIGWHFNPTRPGAAATFALAEEYHDTYYDEGVLARLIAAGEYRPKPAAAPLQRPIMSLWVQEGGGSSRQVDDQGTLLVRNRQARLHLAVSPLKNEQVAGLTWSLGNQQGTFQAQAQDEWTADLSDFNWQRAITELQISVETYEEKPQTFREFFKVRFQPYPPTLSATVPENPVEEVAFNFRGQMRPVAGEKDPVVVQLWHNGKQVKDWKTSDPLGLAHALQLSEGVNRLELVAVVEKPLPGFEEVETARSQWQLIYNPKAVPPPQIRRLSVVPFGQSESVAAKEGDDPIVVVAPNLRIRTEIHSEQPLTRVEYALSDENTTSAKLDGKTLRAKINWPVELKPGLHTLRVRAQAEKSVLVEKRIQVLFRPPVPAVTILTPRPGATFFSGASPQVEILGQSFLSKKNYPFDANLLVNGKRAKVEFESAESGQLKTKVQLVPGENRLELRLANKWGGMQKSSPVVVRYRRPPRVVAPQVGRVASRAVDVKFQVQTPNDLPLTQVQVNGYALPETALQRQVNLSDATTWHISAQAVGLKPGKNVVRLIAFNADGPCLKPVDLELNSPPSRMPVPQIRFTSPQRDLAVASPEIDLSFQVDSTQPLRRVTLYRNGIPAWQQTEFEGSVHEFSHTLELDRGSNQIEAVAVSNTGVTSSKLTISYVRQPVRIVVDRLESITDRSVVLKPQASAGNAYRFNRGRQ